MSGESIMGTVATGARNLDHDMSLTVRERSRVAILAVAPLVLLVAFVAHPYIGVGPPDEAAVARAVAANPFRWGISASHGRGRVRLPAPGVPRDP